MIHKVGKSKSHDRLKQTINVLLIRLANATVQFVQLVLQETKFSRRRDFEKCWPWADKNAEISVIRGCRKTRNTFLVIGSW
jgi:hypothetical protein